MGTLASQADNGVWVQALRALAVVRDIIPGKFITLYMQNPAIYCILAFLDTLTMGTARSHAFSSRNDLCSVVIGILRIYNCSARSIFL